MIEVKNCPVCGANSFKEVYKAPYFRGDNELFTITECENCQLWVTNPRPADDELGGYYETEDYISHTDKKEGLIDHLYHIVRSFALKKKVALINKVNQKAGKLLDYGAGTGHFTSAAKRAGWQVTGVEPSEEARTVARESNGLEFYSPTSFDWGEGKFDVITLFHVLEHLPDLQNHVEKFARALSPNGALIIAVPNHESMDSELYKENWAALDVPLHLYHFKKKNIRMLGQQHGLKLEEVKNMPFDSFYVSLLSEKIATGKNGYLKAFLNGLKSNVKGIPDNNASSLIYILRKGN